LPLRCNAAHPSSFVEAGVLGGQGRNCRACLACFLRAAFSRRAAHLILLLAMSDGGAGSSRYRQRGTFSYLVPRDAITVRGVGRERWLRLEPCRRQQRPICGAGDAELGATVTGMALRA